MASASLAQGCVLWAPPYKCSHPHCSQHRDTDGQHPGALLAHPATGCSAVQVLPGCQEHPANGACVARGGPTGNQLLASTTTCQPWSCSGLMPLLTAGSPKALTAATGTSPRVCGGNWGYRSSSRHAWLWLLALGTNRQCQSPCQRVGGVKGLATLGDQHCSCKPGDSHGLRLLTAALLCFSCR